MKRLFFWSLLLCAVCAPAIVSAQTEEVVYYHTDAAGHVRMITDANGAVIARYDFLPFGESWNPPSNPDTRQYASKERDPETGLDHFGARYFRAPSGRFITVDPVVNVEAALVDPRRWNRYAYANNNPLKFTDPDGKDPRLIGGLIGATVYGGWQAYWNVQQGRSWYDNIGVEAGKGFVVGATFGLAAPILAGTTAAELGTLTTATATIAGPLGNIARSDLDKAMNPGGQTIELVTKLTQSPAAGRALSAAGGEGAQALAAASRASGTLYSARIPEAAIKLLQRAGVLEIRATMMNGVKGAEYRFRAEAMDYLSRYFQELR